MKALLIIASALLLAGCATVDPGPAVQAQHFNKHAVIVPNGVYCTDDPAVVGPKAIRHFVIPAESGRMFDKGKNLWRRIE